MTICARPPTLGAESARSPEQLIEACRSADLFLQKRAESEMRRAGASALPALAASLDDADLVLALRIRPIFRDVLRTSLDKLDAGALTLDELKDLQLLVAKLEKAIPQLTAETATPPAPEEDPEKERQVEAARAEKSQQLRASEEALRDAKARLTRLPENARTVEEAQGAIIRLGAAAFGPLLTRRESVVEKLKPFYDRLLKSIRDGLDERSVLGDPPAPAPAAAGDGARDPFERKRFILSPVWGWEIEQKGPLAEKAAPLLTEHLRRTIDDLAKPGRRELAEESLFTLGDRGQKALADAAEAVSGRNDRLKSLLLFRIEPRVAERTGIDFRGYQDLPFRERRRLVIHYARVAGRDSVPTLRRLAQDDQFEPSLRVRLAAAEALAGPNIRDLSAIRFFERAKLPELLKIPEIARDFHIINGSQLVQEKRYAEAIEEFRKVLDESPYDMRANYEIAFAYLLLKDYAQAILHFEIARRIDPKDTLTLYNLACAYALDNQLQKALEALEAAVQSGFDDLAHIEADPDLKSLREDPRYHELVDRLRQGTAGKKRAPKDEDR